MISGFDFEDGGRKYTCTVEQHQAAAVDSWWWFGVTSDRQRYAPFRAASGDTRTSVQSGSSHTTTPSWRAARCTCRTGLADPSRRLAHRGRLKRCSRSPEARLRYCAPTS